MAERYIPAKRRGKTRLFDTNAGREFGPEFPNAKIAADFVRWMANKELGPMTALPAEQFADLSYRYFRFGWMD
jgi:hypothetical protein